MTDKYLHKVILEILCITFLISNYHSEFKKAQILAIYCENVTN